MSAPILSLSGVRTTVQGGDGDLHPVDGVSFDIAPGETFALLGESGSGKSLTALSIMRLLPDGVDVTGGQIRFDGSDLLALPEQAMRDVRGRRIAMIFQEPGTSLDPVMTVGDQIREVLERHLGLRGAAADKRALDLLDAVGIPDPRRRLDEFPFQLSGGMKQRVMIAGALAGEPSLLVADEPTTALDVTIQAQVLELLRDLQKRLGMAMLLITHDLGVVADMAHRVGVMYAGQIVELASSEGFFATPAHPYSRKLFESLPTRPTASGRLAVIRGNVPPLGQVWTGCRFADRCDDVTTACRAADIPLVSLPGVDLEHGRATRCILPRRPPLPVVSSTPPDVVHASAAPLLDVQNLRVHFPIRKGLIRRTVGHVRAVDGVDLSIPAGRTLALVGESGCGKTTVGKGIVRLLPLAEGRILMEGEDLALLKGRALRDRRRDFQIIFQDPFASLDPRMRVSELLEEGMTALRPDLDEAGRGASVDALLEAVGLSAEAKGRYPHEFSGGQRQRLAIARALAVEPKLIVCDEPTSALDVSVQAQILNLLRDLQERLGLAYLFISHNISVVRYLAHEVAVMYLGRIVERGPTDVVLRQPAHPYTEALLSAVPALHGVEARTPIRLEGDLPSPAAPPAGCHFHPRCPRATEACRREYPVATTLGAGHTVHCLHPSR
jgi:peptide/nickel transport system ATP-binding protein